MSNALTQLLGGPGHVAFWIQPLGAVLIAARDGVRDARHGEPPYALGLGAARHHRFERLLTVLESMMVAFIVGFVVNLAFQYLARERVRALPGLGYAGLLVALPYALVRALANRLHGATTHRHGGPRPSPT